MGGGNSGKSEELDRSIRGIPIRTFIDEIFKQDRVRKENEGTFKEYPIKLPGIGLHAIEERQKAKEQKALGGKPKNAKSEY